MAKKVKPSQMKDIPVISQDEEIEDLDDLLEGVELHRPNNRYSYFVHKEFEKLRNKGESTTLKEYASTLKSKWKSMTEAQKNANNDIIEEERERFRSDCEKVKNYLLSFNKENATPYRIFLDTRLKEAFENNQDPQDAKRLAREEWENMDPKEKGHWNDLKKENDKWWEKAKHLRTVNAYSVFVQEKILNSKERLTFKDVSTEWAKVKTNPKKLKEYTKKAIDINEKKKKMRDIYEIAHGIRPTKPSGAFQLFMKDAAKEGKFKGKNVFEEGRRLWNELSEEEKDEYLKKSHRAKLCYKYKMMIFKKKLRKGRKARSAYNFFVQSLKKDKNLKLKDGQTFFEYAHEKWLKLPEDKKADYRRKAADEKVDFEEKREKEKDIYSAPKRAVSAYTFFYKERFQIVKNKNKNKKNVEITKMIADEWNGLSEKQRKKYNDLSEKDNERYKKEKKEFKEYISGKTDISYRDDKEKSGTRSRSSSRRRTSRKSQTKSQGKSQQKSTEKSQARSNSNKKSQKSRGSQRGQRDSSKRK